ncbi:hypothetical protein M0R89_11750 [Halorussus limi]|uniref:Thrombospondin type 3 repeat-containing protein n=1 Tax=Halorussus limi TaxID=2938695 RepID=A0A8U0HQK9_9EURY|nr:hypothetical protein [Halorussus limi]UPV73220.1 hypothetical protein M0R89_11750 [Halorussus limi]
MKYAVAVVAAVCVVAGVSTGALAYLGDGDDLSTVDELLGPTDITAADTDGDGLTDGTELDRATDPTVADADADDLNDGREVSAGTDPAVADTDTDGLDDGVELSSETNPVGADTDADGLDDGPEVNEYGTAPDDSDTDGDGLPDREEVTARSTDPAQADTDADGLGDAAEANQRPTNPTRSDTDGDGLADGAEVNDRATDPTVADTDGDNLDDGPEVSEYGTAPDDSDTDGDRFRDGIEARAGSVLSAADPLRKDVFLELDYMRGTTVPEEKLEKVERAFANAPVENPDGSRGISLHVDVSDSPVAPAKNTSLSEYARTYYQSEYDTRGYGYYHALLVREVPDRGAGNRVGLTSTGVDGMIVEHRPSRVRVAKTVMHELGHNLGLHPGEHRGIDSYAVKPERYPSVMNYHRLGRCDCHYDYSDGSNASGDFDDWAHIASALDERAPNASAAPSLVG